jgi:hypothetical protein
MQHIYNDLNIDSFQATQILQVFQETFDIEINQEDFQDAYYISDIVNVLENLGATVDMANTDSSGESGENGNGESGDDDISVISEDDIDESSRQAIYTDVVPYTTLFPASSLLLTYKDLLDTAKRYSKHYIGGTSMESFCCWETEKFTTTPATFTTGIRYNNNSLSVFTVLNQQSSIFKEFNVGSNYTHLLSFANTVTLAMRPTVQFAHDVNITSYDEDEGTDYGVSPASMEFDDEGSESVNIDDTGIAYSGRSSRSGGASTYANETRGCIGEIVSQVTGVCDKNNNCILINPGDDTRGCQVVADVTCTCDCSENPIPVAGDTCSGGCHPDPTPVIQDSCTTCNTTITYTISFCATAFIRGTNIGLASCSATMYTTTPYENNLFDTMYMKIPKYTYFTLSSKPTTNFGISVYVTTDSTSANSGSFCSVTGTIKAGQAAYLFNSNDKTMKTNIAQTIFSSSYLKNN